MMKRLYSSVIGKIKSQVGESIGEVLVALLISSIGLTLLAMMVSSSSRMVERSKSTVHEYVLQSNALEDQSETGTPGTLSFSCDLSETDDSGSIKNITDDSSNPINIKYYINEVIGSQKVISYKKE